MAERRSTNANGPSSRSGVRWGSMRDRRVAMRTIVESGLLDRSPASVGHALDRAADLECAAIWARARLLRILALLAGVVGALGGVATPTFTSTAPADPLDRLAIAAAGTGASFAEVGLGAGVALVALIARAAGARLAFAALRELRHRTAGTAR